MIEIDYICSKMFPNTYGTYIIIYVMINLRIVSAIFRSLLYNISYSILQCSY